MTDIVAVPRETLDRIDVYLAEMRRWQATINLVGPGTLDDAWSRHVLDSLQLGPLADGRVWVDLGSGAGLPGLILAIAGPDRDVHLVESDSRKCAFLRQTARLTKTRVTLHNGRIEDVASRLPKPDVVTARALAPLDRLLGLAEPILAGATALFPKGRSWSDELTLAHESWTFACDTLPSETDREGRILRITQFAGRRVHGRHLT